MEKLFAGKILASRTVERVLMGQSDKEILAFKERSEQVREVFDGIAGRYDLANHVLSAGVDFYWRRAAVGMTEPVKEDRVLDMCCGTGDFAFSFAQGGVGHVVGCDFSCEMIELAKVKQQKFAAKQKACEAGFEWKVGDCTATDFADGSFDIVSCAFGVRNMADLSAGLSEMHRVLRSGGRACILEFTLPKNFLIRWVYLLYFRWVLPLVGGLISGKLSAYQYLSSSVRKWDRDVDLAGELKEAGFAEVLVRPMSFGIASVYVAVRSSGG